MKTKIAVYAGSFDPITNGHVDVVKRASKVFDEIHVVAASNPQKNYDFTVSERVELVKDVLSSFSGIHVVYHDGLLVEYAKKIGANVFLRGLRALSDFDYEFHMATMNRDLQPDIETFFVTAGARYFYINSTTIKELAKHGQDVSSYVPESVAKALQKKYTKKISHSE